MISPCLPASTPLHACGVDDGTGHRSQSCSRSGSLRPNATGSVLESSEAERRFEFISFWGFFVFFLYTMRRVNCRRCHAIVVEEVPWGDGKRTLTKAYMLFLARWARHLSWKETALAFR